MADIGRKARREGTWRPRADKPKGYEPAPILQELARDRRNFSIRNGIDFVAPSPAAQKVAQRVRPIGWGETARAASSPHSTPV